jgi:DNA-binding transcriptional LysR family regulator
METAAEFVSTQQLRCFCAAIELGSFTAAGTRLRISQPAVAEQMRRLEQILGVDLFVRGRRGVTPTEAGRAFAVHASASLRELEDGAIKLGELKGIRSGTIAIGFFNEPSVWRIHEVVAAFLDRHPTVSVRIVGSNSSIVADLVHRGDLEAGIVVLPLDDDGLDVRPVLQQESLYVSADPARTSEPATIERLVSAPLILYDAGPGERDPVRRQLADRAQAAGLRLVPKVEVESRELALQLVAAGVGDTYVSQPWMRASYFPPGLSATAFSPAFHDTFAIITRPGRRLSPGVRELLANLEAHMVAIAEASTADQS